MNAFMHALWTRLKRRSSIFWLKNLRSAQSALLVKGLQLNAEREHRFRWTRDFWKKTGNSLGKFCRKFEHEQFVDYWNVWENSVAQMISVRADSGKLRCIVQPWAQIQEIQFGRKIFSDLITITIQKQLSVFTKIRRTVSLSISISRCIAALPKALTPCAPSSQRGPTWPPPSAKVCVPKS